MLEQTQIHHLRARLITKIRGLGVTKGYGWKHLKMKKPNDKSTSRPLPKSLLKQLSQRSDQELADQFRVTRYQVRKARMERGIRSTRLPWTPRQIALLGTDSDEKIAARLGLTKSSVFVRRKKLGVPAFGQSTAEKSHRWTKRQLAWLGKFSDREIADRIGVSNYTVAYKRRSLGIATRSAGSKKSLLDKLNARQIAKLGTAPDIELARLWGTHRHQVALARRCLGIDNFVIQSIEEFWTPELVERLGKTPDREIADELGVSVTRIAGFRNRNGIANQQPDAHQKIDWNPELIKRLGQITDAKLAHELGVSHQLIQQKRNQLGIKPFRARSKKPLKNS